MPSSTSPTHACKHNSKSETPDFDRYRPFFGWVNANTIKETFKHTTQQGASINTFPMNRHLKSRNPALNVPRRHEVLPQTLFILIHQLLIVMSRWHNFLLGKSLWLLTSTQCSLVSNLNLSIHWRTISADAVLWTS